MESYIHYSRDAAFVYLIVCSDRAFREACNKITAFAHFLETNLALFVEVNDDLLCVDIYTHQMEKQTRSQ